MRPLLESRLPSGITLRFSGSPPETYQRRSIIGELSQLDNTKNQKADRIKPAPQFLTPAKLGNNYFKIILEVI
jgi:hypothetical protein